MVNLPSEWSYSDQVSLVIFHTLQWSSCFTCCYFGGRVVFSFFLSLIVPRVELPQAGIKLTPTAVEVQSLKHWTTREAPGIVFSREWNTKVPRAKDKQWHTRALGTIERTGAPETITQQDQLAINITGSWGICFLWRYLAVFKFLWIDMWSWILTHTLDVS